MGGKCVRGGPYRQEAAWRVRATGPDEKQEGLALPRPVPSSRTPGRGRCVPPVRGTDGELAAAGRGRRAVAAECTPLGTWIVRECSGAHAWPQARAEVIVGLIYVYAFIRPPYAHAGMERAERGAMGRQSKTCEAACERPMPIDMDGKTWLSAPQKRRNSPGRRIELPDTCYGADGRCGSSGAKRRRRGSPSMQATLRLADTAPVWDAPRQHVAGRPEGGAEPLCAQAIGLRRSCPRTRGKALKAPHASFKRRADRG